MCKSKEFKFKNKRQIIYFMYNINIILCFFYIFTLFVILLVFIFFIFFYSLVLKNQNYLTTIFMT